MSHFKTPLFLLITATLAGAAATAHLTGCSAKGSDKTCDQGNGGESALSMCGNRAGMVKGIDVAGANGDIDWDTVKKGGIGWGYAQVSDGLTADDHFSDNWKGMKKAGVVRGAYQYFYPGVDAKQQADLFIKSLKDAGKIGVGDLPPVLDLEEVTDEDGNAIAGKDIVDAATTWLTAVEQATGRKPMVMTSPVMTKLIGLKLKSYSLWIAQYRNDCPDLSSTWKTWSWDFWTYSQKQKVAGVPEGVVYSAFFQGTANDLKMFTAEASADGGAGEGGASVADGGSTSTDAGASRDSGTTARDSGTTSTQDSGTTTTADSGSSSSGDDAGTATGSGDPNPDQPTSPSGSGSGSSSGSGKGGPRSQREETPADPCAKSDSKNGN